MEVVRPGRPLIAPPIVMPGQAALPTLREFEPEIDDGSFGVKFSQEAKTWVESTLVSLIINMALMIIGGLIFSNEPQSQTLEMIATQSVASTEIEVVKAVSLQPDVAISQQTVLGSTSDAVAKIDLKQVTLAGGKGSVATEDFAPNGVVAGEGSGQGKAGRGNGNGIGDLLGGAFGDRLMQAGAKTGDVQISLIWNDKNDLDLHVITPKEFEIWFGNKLARQFAPCGGRLDVDRNDNPFQLTETPVENIFWPKGKGLNGTYRVFVKFFANHDKSARTSKFEVAIKVNNEVETFEGEVRSVNEIVEVTTFVKRPPGAAAKNASDKPVVKPKAK